MKKRLVLIVSLIVIAGLTVNVTMAMIKKTVGSQDEAFTVIGLDSYIVYNKGTDVLSGTLDPVYDYTKTKLQTEITLYKASAASSRTVYGHIYLNPTVDSTAASNGALKWLIKSNNIILAEGNFKNHATTTIPMVMNIPMTTTATKYQIYIWVDKSMNYGSSITNVNNFSGKSVSAVVRAEASENQLTATARYKVTFAPNGGSLSPTYKYVVNGGKYGVLPTPTRAGYRFLGWNGKNMYNEDVLLGAINGYKYELNHHVFTSANAYNLYGKDGATLPITGFASGSRYVISASGYIEQSGKNLLIRFHYVDGATSVTGINVNSLTESSYSSVSTSGYDIDYAYMTYNNSGTVHLTHVQIEKGTAATAWEPYYLNSEVNVTVNQDHTLTAIWEAV